MFLHFLSWYFDEIGSDSEFVLERDKAEDAGERDDAVDDDDLLVDVADGDSGSKS